jgi:hypothetical protein
MRIPGINTLNKNNDGNTLFDLACITRNKELIE